MLTKEQIESNKKEFLQLINEIDIPGADIEGLKNFLETSDFFVAPASTIYHCGYEGGLCQHSLNVYYNLLKLVDVYQNIIPKYNRSSLIAVALLHDISKTNFYEKYTMNKKVYDPRGSKHDNMGNFDWFAEEAYKVKDARERKYAGEHEELAMLLAGQYIPFNLEEVISILHHHANMNNGRESYDLTAMLNKYPLLTLLHMADVAACFIQERI